MKQSCFWKKALVATCLWAGIQVLGMAQTVITVTGSWSYSVSSLDVVDAGSNYVGTYTSAANQALIDINRNNNGNVQWRVDIRKSDISWNSLLQVWVQRTGTGTPNHALGTISGGTTYQQITNSDLVFFTGRRGWFDIPIQYQLRNITVAAPATTHSTSIIYTVTQI